LKADLNENKVQGIIVCKKAELKPTKRPNNYFCDFTLFTGEEEINGKTWDYNKNAPIPADNSLIYIQATKSTWNNAPQLTVISWRYTTEEEQVKINTEDFLPSIENKEALYYEVFLKYVNSISDSNLQDFVRTIVEAYKTKIINSPAAIMHHHNYIGGLLEHTCETAAYAIDIGSVSTKSINFDLIKTGALLHDIGKIKVYDYSSFVIDMTFEGKMLDHIILGLKLIEDFKELINADTFMLVSHIIAAHHLKLEYGSPVEPILKEATIVAYADNLSATYNRIDKSLDNDSQWVPVFGFKHPFYNKNIL